MEELFIELVHDIKSTIQANVKNATVIILDPRNDGVHLEALVISPTFEGLSLIKQQQMVMKALKEHFSTTLHALGLKTFTPDHWEKVKENYKQG